MHAVFQAESSGNPHRFCVGAGTSLGHKASQVENARNPHAASVSRDVWRLSDAEVMGLESGLVIAPLAIHKSSPAPGAQKEKPGAVGAVRALMLIQGVLKQRLRTYILAICGWASKLMRAQQL